MIQASNTSNKSYMASYVNIVKNKKPIRRGVSLCKLL